MDSGTIAPECEAACGDASNPTQTLYRFHAFDLSYFSAKVRPALCYPELSDEELRPDLGGMRGHIGLTFIPILLTRGGRDRAGLEKDPQLAQSAQPRCGASAR